ncbi:MAG: V-type ATP synthase subunit F [bacterium]
MSEKLAIIGNQDSILGFKAFGLDCFPVEKSSEALDILKTLMLKKKEYAAIYMTDDLALEIDAELEEIKKGAPLLPVLVIIPSQKGSLDTATIKIRRMVEKALGMDIFKEEK